MNPTDRASPLAYLLVLVVSSLMALLHVFFRDVRYVVTALLLVAFYGTPVGWTVVLLAVVLRSYGRHERTACDRL